MDGGGTSVNDGGEDDAGSLSCLVAVGRALNDLSPVLNQQVPTPPTPPARRLQYISRHATDGKFLFVDQRYNTQQTDTENKLPQVTLDLPLNHECFKTNSENILLDKSYCIINTYEIN